MPGIDGETLIHKVKKIYPSLPCLLMSGYSDAFEKHTSEFCHVCLAPTHLQIFGSFPAFPYSVFPHFRNGVLGTFGHKPWKLKLIRLQLK